MLPLGVKTVIGLAPGDLQTSLEPLEKHLVRTLDTASLGTQKKTIRRSVASCFFTLPSGVRSFNRIGPNLSSSKAPQLLKVL